MDKMDADDEHIESERDMPILEEAEKEEFVQFTKEQQDNMFNHLHQDDELETDAVDEEESADRHIDEETDDPHMDETVEEEEEDVDDEEYEEVPPPGYQDSADEYLENNDDQTGPHQNNSEEGENNNNQETEEQPDASSKRKRTASHSSADEGPKRKQVRSSGSTSGQKHDTYCWVCHKVGVQAFCKICPRAYHTRCMHVPDESSKGDQSTDVSTKTCICPECAIVMNAENLETRSETMKKLTVDQLISMLKHTCDRLKNLPHVEPFLYPVDPEDALDYFNYVVYPMDLSTLELNVKRRQYGSTEAFLADAQWLVHNSVVFNTATSPFTATAKKILKTCRQEIQDIETCSECYVNAYNKPDVWFQEVCKRPHVLVWAKLKGFPFWPAKAMRIKDDMVDVRFFGAHDRAWVVKKDCFLYSVENPTANAGKRNSALQAAIDELNIHAEKLKEHYGPLVFAAARTPIGSQLSLDEIRKMLPEYKPEEANSKVLPAIAQPAKKSPMTIRISSLKTNPTIVTNSVVEETSANKPTLRVRKNVVQDTTPSHESTELPTTGKQKADSESKQVDEHSSEDNEADEKSNKPTGILATALSGSGRLTRRSSRSETGAASPAQDHGDKRVPRPISEDDSKDQQRELTPPPPKSFLNSLGLSLKASQVGGDSIRPKIGKLLHPSEVFVKSEPSEIPDDEHSDEGGSTMNQMSANSGMRFNLSKDISISPVGGEDGEETRLQQRRTMIQGHNTRLLPGLIPQNMQMMGGRPRGMMNVNGGMQRLPGQQNRLVQRSIRPGMPTRPGIKVNGPRPQNMQQIQVKNHGGNKPKDGSSTLLVDSTNFATTQGTFSNTVQLNQVGAITLPGGTITVTPLAPVIGAISDTMNGGQVIVKQNIASTANGLPISVLASHEGSQSLLKSNNKPNPQRRNLMNQVPSSVGHLVQNLQKSLVENVKTTMEQIVVEMLEKSNSSGSGPEMKTLKDENEKLKKQLLDYKNSHDASVRELKAAMELEKKRAINEQRKLLEQEKTKAVEEAKKKQWCARCGREAQFYCCWNTSYCGYPCQEDHWPSHMNACSQSSRQ